MGISITTKSDLDSAIFSAIACKSALVIDSAVSTLFSPIPIGKSVLFDFSPGPHRACDFHRTRRSIGVINVAYLFLN